MFSTYLSRWKHHFVRIQRGSLEQTIQSFRIKIGFRALARSLFTKDNNFPHRLWRLFLQEKWSAISVTRLGKISPLLLFFLSLQDIKPTLVDYYVLGQISLLSVAQYWRNNTTIWSHCRSAIVIRSSSLLTFDAQGENEDECRDPK